MSTGLGTLWEKTETVRSPEGVSESCWSGEAGQSGAARAPSSAGSPVVTPSSVRFDSP